MDQAKKKSHDDHSGQFQYNGRWVEKDTFRAFVYDKQGNSKLASSYNEFISLTESGIYFASKPEAVNKDGKPKNVTLSNGK